MNLAFKEHFNLKAIIQESIEDIKEFDKVYSYLIKTSEEKLATRCTDSALIEIAQELVSRLFVGGKNED